MPVSRQPVARTTRITKTVTRSTTRTEPIDSQPAPLPAGTMLIDSLSMRKLSAIVAAARSVQELKRAIGSGAAILQARAELDAWRLYLTGQMRLAEQAQRVLRDVRYWD